MFKITNITESALLTINNLAHQTAVVLAKGEHVIVDKLEEGYHDILKAFEGSIKLETLSPEDIKAEEDARVAQAAQDKAEADKIAKAEAAIKAKNDKAEKDAADKAAAEKAKAENEANQQKNVPESDKK